MSTKVDERMLTIDIFDESVTREANTYKIPPIGGPTIRKYTNPARVVCRIEGEFRLISFKLNLSL